MTQRPTLRRRILLSLTGLLGILAIGSWVGMRSPAAHRMVVNQLREQIGTQVETDAISLGYRSISITGFRLAEAKSDSFVQPWLSAARAEIDVGATSAITGAEPKTIVLHDAAVVLQFDAEGDLLTRLPRPKTDLSMPTIRVESGTLTLKQLGRPDSNFHGIKITIREVDGREIIDGVVTDEAWGRWIAEGNFHLSEKSGKLTLRTEEPHEITSDLLERTPFVNPNAWKNVILSGSTNARLDIDFNAAEDRFSYRMVMEPTRTDVFIPSINLKFHDASGTVIAQGSEVTLKDIEGNTADGRIVVDSKMNFANRDDVLTFNARLRDVEVRKLPANWRVPEPIAGKLTGDLEFGVKILKAGGFQTDGKGSGTIQQASFNGTPTGPITLKLRPSLGDAGGFEFTEQKMAKADGPDLKTPEPKKPEPKNVEPKKDEPKPGIVSSVLKFAAKIVKPANAPPDEKSYLHVNLTFRDVEISEVLKAAKVDVPVKMAGKATLAVQIDIPTEHPDEIKFYRVKGTLSSKALTIDDLTINDITAKLDYREYLLKLDDFRGRLPALGNTETGGSFSGNGELRIGLGFLYKAKLKFDKIALNQIDRLKTVLPLGIPVEGDLDAEANLSGTLAPLTFRTNGTAKTPRVRVGMFPVDDVSLRWRSDKNTVTFSDVSAKMFGGLLSGGFEVPLRDSVSAGGKLVLTDLDLGAFSTTIPESAKLKLEGSAGGTILLSIPAAGEGKPRETSAEIDLKAPKLKLQNIPAEKIKGTAKFLEGVLKYKLTGDALGGNFELEGQYPNVKKEPPPKKADPKDPLGGLSLFNRIRFKNTKLTKLWEQFKITNTLGQLDADVSFEISLSPNAAKQSIGEGPIRIERLRWGDKLIAPLGQGIVRLGNRKLHLEQLTLPVGEGYLFLSATMDRFEPDRSTIVANLTNVPVAKILFLFPEFARKVDFNVNGRLSGNIGREWHGSGLLTSSKGTFLGIPVTDFRIPITWSAIPGAGRAELYIRDYSGSVAQGRVSGKSEFFFSSEQPTRMSGDVTFNKVNLTNAFSPLGTYFGNVPINGRFEFGAEQLRTDDDVKGRLTAVVGEATPFGLPVFSALVPFLGLGRDNTTSIKSGELKATLAANTWRVEKLTLSGPSLDVFAEGIVRNDGRLNLNVVGSTGQARRDNNSAITRLVQIASQTAQGPLNRSNYTDALGILTNLSIYLEVSGNIRNPTVRVQAAKTLTEDTVRFFLLRFALPLPF
jgi:hypothetical protein